MWLAFIFLYSNTGLEVYFLEGMRQKVMGLEMSGEARGPHAWKAEAAHTPQAEGLDAATFTLFPTRLQKRWQPVPNPLGKRLV